MRHHLQRRKERRRARRHHPRYVFEDGDDDVSLRFPLSYAGSLPSRQGEGLVQAKHDIRRKLHSQLHDLVQRSRALQLHVGLMQGRNYDSRIGQSLTDLAARCRLAGFAFIPLVVGVRHMQCHLDIRFLRRERPGDLITKPKDEYGGDLDNRLKIFLDALRVPCEANEVPGHATPGPGEEPFYCLLQDDSLITKFQVASDMLLGDSSPETRKDVQLLVDVTILPMPDHWTNEE